MATSTYCDLEKEYYPLADDYDLVIRVIQQEKRTRTEGDAPNIRNVVEYVDTKVYERKVKRGVLLDASVYFKTLLHADFKESQQAVIDLKEESAESVQGVITWLEILHGSDFTYSSIDIRHVWEMLAAAHKYGLDPNLYSAKAWFNGWYKEHHDGVNYKSRNFEDCQMLMFPCYTFNHSKGFAAATKYLAYHATGHVVERRPDGFTLEHLRLDQRIIQQVNAAKGRLKTILHRELYNPIDKLLKHDKCDCKEKVLYAYEKALTDTGAWPLETAYVRQSMYGILRKLRSFPDGKEPTSRGHAYCSFNFASTVENAVSETSNYFDGLCLDCMNGSKFGDADADYWRHAHQGVRWDDDCRIDHDQPTWYFSFMGRREKMIQWTQRRRSDHD